jgi:hypothetical protein
MAAVGPNAVVRRLYALVDHDNLRRFARGKTLRVLITHLISKIPDPVLIGHTHLEFRLYGGWRSSKTITHIAQGLAVEIQQEYPLKLLRTLPDGTKLGIRLDVSLAYSPLFSPAMALSETFARGRSSRRIYPEPRPWITCANSSACVLTTFESFLAKEVCPNTACTVVPPDVLRQDEQKQVDTLMVADMAHLAMTEHVPHIVLVTSDTDIWPGVMLSTMHGANVHQIHTMPGTASPTAQLAALGSHGSRFSNTSV